MEPFGIGMAGLGLAGVASVGAFGLAFRQRRRRLAALAPKAPRRPRSAADRLEALAAAQADLGLRLDALAAQGAPEERLQAMAGQLLGLIRDKNATFETAVAGLDQLRARMRALEQMGEPAEARALLDRLTGRLDELQTGEAARTAALEARLGALESGPFGERLAKEGREGMAALQARLEALQGEQAAARAEIAALKAGPGPARALAEQLARLHAQKEALAEQVLGRLAALEKETGAPQAAIERLAERLEALRAAQGTAENTLGGRLAALESGGPFGEVSAQLAALHGQKDAAVAAVLARLGPLEERVAALAAIDPEAAAERFAERLEAARAGLQAQIDALNGGPFAELSERLTALYAGRDAGVEALARLQPLEARLAATADEPARVQATLAGIEARLAVVEGAENPFAEVSEQLTRLYGQKDAGIAAMLARLAPVEAQLAAVEARLGEPQALLDRFAERLEAVQGRVALLEDAENPFGEIAEQLTRLYGQKDAGIEAMLARLQPLEAKLAALEAGDGRALLDRFAERLEAVQGRVALLEDAENPFGEIAEQLTKLYGQKDAGIEAMLARLAPLEAKLAALEAGDGRALLDRFAERLEAVQGRVALLEGAETPFGEIAEQLTKLYGQKDAAVEAVLARLQPLEAKLTGLEGGLARVLPLAEDDPRAAVDGLRARLEALNWAQGEVAAGLAALRAGEGGLAGIAEQLTRLHARKDAGIAAVLERLAPLETRIAELEARPWDPDGEAERAETQAIAAQLLAVRVAAEQTAGLAERLARLEAGAAPAAATAGAPAARAPTAEEIEAIWTLPRIVSLHQK